MLSGLKIKFKNAN